MGLQGSEAKAWARLDREGEELSVTERSLGAGPGLEREGGPPGGRTRGTVTGRGPAGPLAVTQPVLGALQQAGFSAEEGTFPVSMFERSFGVIPLEEQMEELAPLTLILVF